MDYYKQGHCVYSCTYHLVLVTKYRRKVFGAGVFEYFKKLLEEVKRYYPEVGIEEVNHDEDHVHLLVRIPPKYSVSKVVNILKSNTGRQLKEKFEFLKKVYWGTTGIWSEGYFVTTVGVNEKVIRTYIEMQGEEDSGQAKLEM